MKTELEKYTQRTGIIASLIGLVVVYLIFATMFAIDEGIMDGLLWAKRLDEVWLNILSGCVGVAASAYFISQYAAPKSSCLVSILKCSGIAIASMFSGTLIGSTLRFLQEAHFNDWPVQLPDGFYDYYVKPLFWVGIFGTIPAIFFGGVWGAVLHLHRRKYKSSVD